MVKNNFINNFKFITMKGIKKLLPVLAVVALASCSSDDLIESTGNVTLSRSNIGLYLDDAADTRTGVQESEDARGFVWTKDDVIKLYGVSERLTNTYKVTTSFDNGSGAATYDKAGLAAVATLQGSDNISSGLAYAIYPGTRENFFNSEYFEQFEMQLPAAWAYNNTLAASNVYYADFPMWGEANDDHTKVTFKYTTAFFRFELSGLSAASEARLIITADKQINGRFTGDLYDALGNPVSYPSLVAADNSNPSLVYANATSLANDDTGANYIHTSHAETGFAKQQITISLGQLSNNDSRIVYVPVPAQAYGYVSVALYYPAEARQDVILAGRTATLSRGQFINIKRAMSVTDQFYTPSDINQELYDNRAKAEDLNYVSHVKMDVAALDPSNEGTSTILVPNMASDEITLNFDYATAPAIAGTHNTLYIKDLDAANPYTGKLSINTASIETPLDINLPEADVQLIGAGGATYNYLNINVQAAKSITFGDGTTATKQSAGDIKTAYADAGPSVTVKKNATAYSVRLANKDAVVTVEGTAERVGFDRNNPTLTVTGGTINFLRSYFTPSAADKAVGKVTSTGAANIKKVDSGEANFEFVSTWDGTSKVAPTENNVYTAAQLANYQGTAAADVTINLKANIDLGADNNWEGINATSAYDVTINATNSHFDNTATPVRAAVDGIPFQAKHIISNLNLSKTLNATATANATDLSQTGLGFITVAKNVTVNNPGLDINGVTCQLNKYNKTTATGNKQFAVDAIGSLVGQVVGDISLKDVKVNIDGVFGYVTSVASQAANIGGIVGEAQGDVTIESSSLTGTANISGYYNLGGIVGGATSIDKAVVIGGDAAAKNCSATLNAFTVTYDNGKTIDKNIGRIGGFIGSVGVLEAETGTVYYIGKAFTSAKTDRFSGTATVTTWPDVKKNKILMGTAPDFDYLTLKRQAENNFIGYIGDKKANNLTIYFGNATAAKNVSLTEPASDVQGNYLYWFNVTGEAKKR